VAKHITRDDTEAAGARIAARLGITVDEHRARVRNAQRECARTGCEETFSIHDNDRRRYCSDACKALAGRLRSGGAS
jgi:hypothetical protein